MSRILVAGAAGVIGRQLIPLLVTAGHDVHGTTRSVERAAWLRAAGAVPVVVDVFDRDALADAVTAALPDVVIHQLTDLAAGYGPASLEANARLREAGTANLVDAALAAGARRVIAQSIAWLYAPGPEPHGESDSLLDRQSDPANPVLRGILELERLILTTAGFDGLVLRYGRLYGPGTGAASPAAPTSVHVAGAARAAVLAVDRGTAGAYNIVDDGGPASNARARSMLGWAPG
jgi:nucleoside-diphosphate-sugar epimerase